MSLQFRQSADLLADATDTVLSTVSISNPADLTPGTHTVSFTIGTQVLLPGAGKTEPTGDYFILAVLDPADSIPEVDASLNEDNTKPLVGVYATSTGIYAQGGPGVDAITVTYPSATTGNFTVDVSGSLNTAISAAYSQTTAFRFRLHDGNDTVNVVTTSVASRPMLELGGDGDDVLSGGSGADTLNGGDGDDTLSGKLGNDVLDGGADTNMLSESGNVNFTLTNAKLTGLGTDTLINLAIANLTGGASANTFTVSGWTRPGSLNGGGGNDTIIASKNSDFTLMNTGLQTSDGMSLSLSGGITNATLTGGAGNNAFTVGAWTGIGKLAGGTGTDTLRSTRDTDQTLTSTSLAATGFGTLTLSAIESAELTGGLSDNVFTVSGWKGTGTLVAGGGGTDSVVAVRAANFILSDAQLVASNGLSMTLSGIRVANLSGSTSNNVFTVSGWTGSGQIDGLTGTDTIVVARDTDMTMTNTALVSVGFGTLTLVGIESASLTGGSGANVLNAAEFTGGPVTLQGGSGDDVLIGGSTADSLRGGAGRDLLIGGRGADTLSGDADDDLLIGGTSSVSANMAAINAVMAEWTSAASSSTRVANLLNGGGLNGMTKLDNTTIQNDASAADRLAGGTEFDWFFKSASDVLVDFNVGLGEMTTGI